MSNGTVIRPVQSCVSEKAWAKLNISLDVTERRADGYHNMVMVMQTVSLSDEVSIRLNNAGTVRACSNLSFIPGDERNLAVRAALRYLREIGCESQGIDITLDKHIPVGAGMGGGSSDAAAVLRALNLMYGRPLSMAELERISGDVGSDVPFCISGGTSLAKGRGEELTVLPPLPPCRFIICKPDFSVSTPELFKKLDQISLRIHPDTAGIVSALGRGELKEICRRMYNVFEDVEDRRLRKISEIKNMLLDFGALGAVMTGTGSAVFGVFPPEFDGTRAVAALKKEYGFCASAEAVERIV